MEMNFEIEHAFAEQSISWEPREWSWWSSWIEERNVSEQNLKQAPL